MENGTVRRWWAPPLAAALIVLLLVWLGLATPAGAQDDTSGQDGTPATEEATNQTEPTATEQAEPAATEQEEPTATEEAEQSDAAEADEVPAEPSEVEAAAQADGTNAAGVTVMQVAEDLNLRAEPNIEAEILTVVPAGAEVSVAADAQPESDFLPVTFEGQEGWAHLAYLLAGSDNLATVVEDLNLRTDPNLESDVLTVMPAGSQVRVFGTAEDADGGAWSKVRFADSTGWASAEFLASGDAGNATSGASAASGEERIALVDLNLRAGPSTEDAVLLVIPAGGSLTLTQEGAENGLVTAVFDGTSGWVAAEFIARPDQVEGLAASEPVESGGSADVSDQARFALADLNLRAGPSTDDAVLLVIPAGATVTLTGEGAENGFVTVEYQGTVGWAAAEFLGE